MSWILVNFWISVSVATDDASVLFRRFIMQNQIVPFVQGFVEKPPQIPVSRLVYDDMAERSDFSRGDTKNPLLMSPTHIGQLQDEAH